MPGVLGGALVPHAPQFFSLPETEDKATVERVRSLMGEVGRRLAALRPDVWIVIANDHANQFLLHCTPPFCFHLGAEVGGLVRGPRISASASTARRRCSSCGTCRAKGSIPPSPTMPRSTMPSAFP